MIYIYIYIHTHYTYWRARRFVFVPVGQRIGSRMREVRGSNPRLGGSRVLQFQVSGGMGTLQSVSSGLQSTTQGIPSGPKDSSESKNRFAQATGGGVHSGL